MFVRNASSIKRKTIKADDDAKNYLVRKGFSPVSKEDGKWIFIANDTIASLVRDYHKGVIDNVKDRFLRCWRRQRDDS